MWRTLVYLDTLMLTFQHMILTNFALAAAQSFYPFLKCSPSIILFYTVGTSQCVSPWPFQNLPFCDLTHGRHRQHLCD